MFHKNHCGSATYKHIFYLHTRYDIYKIQRLIPDIQVGAAAQAGRQQTGLVKAPLPQALAAHRHPRHGVKLAGIPPGGAVGHQSAEAVQSAGAAHIGKALFLSDVPGDGLLRDALDDRRLSRSGGPSSPAGPVEPGGISPSPSRSGESTQPSSMLSGS